MSQPTATASDQDDPPANKSAPDTEPETTSIELNLRLDENGRTTYDPLLLETSSDAAVGKGDDDALATCNSTEDYGKDEHPSKKARTEAPVAIDYSSKSTMTNLSETKLVDAMDALLFDCEVIAISAG
jgi:hypothetical protein